MVFSSTLRLVSILAFLLPGAAMAELSLVMIEEEGCIYCVRWNEEVGIAYPRTPEGAAAPLRRVDIDALPEDVIFTTRPVFTPTFVLVENGEELGRLEGYPGEDFFWPLLGRLLDQRVPDWREEP